MAQRMAVIMSENSTRSARFAAGSEVLTVTITINEDDYDEANETFGIIVQLDPDDPYTKYVVGTTFTIVDDDEQDQTSSGSYFTGDDTNETWAGTTSADNAYGNGGRDTLSGLEGSDAIYGGAGSDEIYGGSGNDYLYTGKRDGYRIWWRRR